ncbi:hypothetical protein GGS26DRAFT_542221 [Hypomontagnella submonticulosa]|nr:hypothetical protein GGS26DRAFT_542221 [Hypomontagnella submonticulosa]
MMDCVRCYLFLTNRFVVICTPFLAVYVWTASSRNQRQRVTKFGIFVLIFKSRMVMWHPYYLLVTLCIQRHYCTRYSILKLRLRVYITT